MCASEATFLPTDWCCNEWALQQSNNSNVGLVQNRPSISSQHDKNFSLGVKQQ